MEDEGSFHGFPDDDVVRSTLQEKLARLKPIREEASQANLSRGSSAQVRPMNRFLKRSSSSTSTGQDRPASNAKALISPPIQRTPPNNISPVVVSSLRVNTVSNLSDKPNQEPVIVSPPLPKKTTEKNEAVVPTVRGPTKNFLKLSSPAKPPRETETTFKNIALPILKSAVEPSEKIQPVVKVSVENSGEKGPPPLTAKIVNEDHTRKTVTKEVHPVVTDKTPVKPKSDHKEKSESEKPSQIIGKSISTIESKELEQTKSTKKTVSAKSPSPAKRAASISSELGFLGGQSVRSKRTIVPNKRFFSTDSPPPVTSSKQLESKSVSTSEVPLANASKGPKKSKQNGQINSEVPSKKRSVSGDSFKGVNRKRKLSAEPMPTTHNAPSGTNGTSCSPTETSAQSLDASARPRRTIIPNRKFLDDEVVLNAKEPVVKKLNETVELNKRKRRKSEKGVVANTEKEEKLIHELPISKPPSNTSVQINGPITPLVKVENGAKASVPGIPVVSTPVLQASVSSIPITNGSSMPTQKTDEKIESKSVEIKLDVDDQELPVTEVDLQAYGSNPLFLGACVLNAAVDQTNNENKGIIIRCGVCSRVKKYRAVTEKRKRGSFLCTDCLVIVHKIFQIAMKAKPFSSIVGPPVCEGACPITFNPPDQFCQACFAKICLRNLPMKDDVYFKVWRSIPPMSRGCVSTVPVVNTASPHVGKVVYVSETGEIVSTTGSLKMLGGGKKMNGTDATSEDSNSSNDILVNADGDLNSARITTFSHKLGTSTNRENSIPVKGSTESQLLSSTDNLKEIERKVNGVTKEELIFCSMCCEPFHPYCAGDDLLLDTYIARCNNDNDEDSTAYLETNEANSTVCRKSVESRGESDPSRLVLKWTCRRCLSCKSCGGCIGRKELIRCNRCQNPYHLDTCIDKQILSKIKNRDKLKKIWTCDVCLKCKSCGKMIESNRRLRTIQEVAAAESSEDNDSDDENNESCQPADVGSNQLNRLMLCLDCFKQRKKGSFCPLCEVCYDDNDWDSKMMECCRCNRWIHSTCENMSDEQYYILGKLPEYIEYICRLCHASSSTPLWYDAIQSQLIKECNSAVRLFEQRSLGSLRRKRSSVDVKPTFVCNLFGVSDVDVSDVETGEGEKPVSPQPEQEANFKLIVQESPLEEMEENEEKRLMRRDMTRTVSYKEMMGCKVKLRDFVKYPTSRQEHWYSLKVQGVEVIADYNPNYMREADRRLQMTPIHKTPSKAFTPSKHISSITSVLKGVVGSVTSLHVFRKSLFTTIETTCESKSEKDVLLLHATQSLQETFPWFESSSPNNILAKSKEAGLENPEDSNIEDGQAPNVTTKESHNDKLGLMTDPFREIYWDFADFFDDRPCALCGEVGDFPPEQCGRLLWCGVNEWIHCNCAIWSSEVWELENGALQQVGGALNRGKTLRCKVCKLKGATVSCCHSTCKNSYHFKCAIEANCFLLENKTMFCTHHKLSQKQLDEIQEDMKVGRKVFVDLDWIQKRGIKGHSEEMRVFIGSLKIDCLGKIVPISVVRKEWTASTDTLLLPCNFISHRIFWSLNDPWTKECYTFHTGLSSNGFSCKIQDPGINLVVDYSRSGASIKRGIETIQKFHQWIQKAPKYIDENMIEWLSPCSESFNLSISDDDESGIDMFGSVHGFHVKGRASPSSSVSSLGSFVKVQVLSGSRKRSPYSLRRVPGRPTEEVVENSNCNINEGYTSSASSSIIETPKSLRITRQVKRRRSSYKTRKPPRKRCKFSDKEVYESPRRRSMRNRQMKEVANGEMSANQLPEPPKPDFEDSDNDSGVTEGTSLTLTGEDGFRCRVNLLNRFNASFDEYNLPNEKQGDKEETESESIQVDTMSVSSGVLEQDTSLLNNPNDSMNLSSQFPKEAEAKIYYATINVDVTRRHATICHSCDTRQAWMYLFEEVSKTRRSYNLTDLVHPTLNSNVSSVYMDAVNSFRMLGISHRSVQYLLEQLPGVQSVADQHKFKYSHRPYVDPNDDNAMVQQNSTGSARSEGYGRMKPFDMFGWLASRHRKAVVSCDLSEESSRSQGLPLAMQFRDLKEKARKKFVVLHSEIHGRGLFARCDVEKGEMLIEYAGEVIRPSLSDPREKYYESKGIGCYMFRIKTQVIDATLKGNAARFINHSCEPNCEAKTVRILGKDHIIIFALRKIFKGEELTYDYKFEREEDKIPCSCGAARCRKYMN